MKLRSGVEAGDTHFPGPDFEIGGPLPQEMLAVN